MRNVQLIGIITVMLSASISMTATRYVPQQYSTIQKAVDAAKSYDVIVISNSKDYHESVIIENKSNITIRGSQSAWPYIYGVKDGSTNNYATFELKNCTKVTLRYLNIISANVNGFGSQGVTIRMNCAATKVLNCMIERGGYADFDVGIYDESGYTIIRGCDVSNFNDGIETWASCTINAGMAELTNNNILVDHIGIRIAIPYFGNGYIKEARVWNNPYIHGTWYGIYASGDYDKDPIEKIDLNNNTIYDCEVSLVAQYYADLFYKNTNFSYCDQPVYYDNNGTVTDEGSNTYSECPR